MSAAIDEPAEAGLSGALADVGLDGDSSLRCGSGVYRSCFLAASVVAGDAGWGSPRVGGVSGRPWARLKGWP